GAKHAKALLEPDGTFIVQGWRLTLLELLPDTRGHRHYRIRAEVRHIRGGENGAVGLYFAGTTHHTANVSVLSFLQVSYDDLHDAVDLSNRFPERLRRLAPPPKGNRVYLLSRYWADGVKEPLLNLAPDFLSPELFKPAGHAGRPGEWRTVEI